MQDNNANMNNNNNNNFDLNALNLDNLNLNNNSNAQITCPRCGALNNASSKFCIQCGYNFESVPTNINQISENVETTPNFNDFNSFDNIQTKSNMDSVNTQTINNTVSEPNYTNLQNNSQQESFNQTYNNFQNNVQQDNFQQNTNTNTTVTGGSMSLTDYFATLMTVMINPNMFFKEKLNKLEEFKSSGILVVIVSAIATILSLISTIISTVRVTTYTWLGKSTTTWVWENIKEISFFKTIMYNFIGYIIIIFFITAIYYIGSLIIKKQAKFSKVLAIIAGGLVPVILSSLLLSPILSLVYAPLGFIITMVGSLHMMIIIYEGINNEMMLEGNAKCYFNLGCVTVLLVIAYFILMQVLGSVVSGSLGSFLG